MTSNNNSNNNHTKVGLRKQLGYQTVSCYHSIVLVLLLLVPTSSSTSISNTRASSSAFIIGGGISRHPFSTASPFRRRNGNGNQNTQSIQTTTTTSSTKTSLTAIKINTRNPNQAEAVELGIREWPPQTKRGTWSESIPATSTTTTIRYILDGKGTVEITDTDDDEDAAGNTKVVKVGPGTMVEIDGGPASLSWKTTPSDSEMIVLTPGFEQLGQLVGVAGGLVVLCVALFFGLGGG